eukprot:TRINITY_DN8595_c0_g1_i2.p1 TRINITY_DN8595_c0_g1~~TRINITY_DN8595_c0_g1_i2.p1  ORF type:complete len:392 (+),score=85.81 TRINITY_DN8595_c0_g1_i2:101-1276(+)
MCIRDRYQRRVRGAAIKTMPCRGRRALLTGPALASLLQGSFTKLQTIALSYLARFGGSGFQPFSELRGHDSAGHLLQYVLKFCTRPAVLWRCAATVGFLREAVHEVMLALWEAGEHRRAVGLLIPAMQGCSPDANGVRIRKGLQFNDDGTLNTWQLSNCGLVALPAEFGTVRTTGDLKLFNNQLTSLPEGFGGLTVGGSLLLSCNQLVTLPERFGALTVGKDLWLQGNQLASLPQSFSALNVGNNLWIQHNQLGSLPERFGRLALGGDLDLSSNKLTSLPDGFGALTVRGTLDVSRNELTSLPEDFGALTVGGHLRVHRNRLTSLPESFGCLTVGEDFRLSGNQLTSLVEGFGGLTVGGRLFLKFQGEDIGPVHAEASRMKYPNVTGELYK